MGRDNIISATKPLFPSYLLPSLKIQIPLVGSRRRSSAASSSSDVPRSSAPTSPSSAASSATTTTTPSTSPPVGQQQQQQQQHTKSPGLFRAAPDSLRCMACSTEIAFASQVISKGFTGSHGRAFLVAPPAPPAEPTLLNIREGARENRQLVTGWHVVADINCGTCMRKLGWKYVDAKEESQKYKVGKFILETARVATHRSWEDGPADRCGAFLAPGGEDGQEPSVAFDSDDDEECEEIFAGTWNPDTVARRRRGVESRPGTNQT